MLTQNSTVMAVRRSCMNVWKRLMCTASQPPKRKMKM